MEKKSTSTRWGPGNVNDKGDGPGEKGPSGPQEREGVRGLEDIDSGGVSPEGPGSGLWDRVDGPEGA